MHRVIRVTVKGNLADAIVEAKRYGLIFEYDRLGKEEIHGFVRARYSFYDVWREVERWWEQTTKEHDVDMGIAKKPFRRGALLAFGDDKHLNHG